jgi:methyl-accepting chemotaxis protein
VTEGIVTVEDAIESLEDIVDIVDEASTGVQSINEATDDQAASTEEVVSMMDEIGTASGRTNEETEDVAAAAEEQTSSIDEVTTQIVDLSEQATDLRALLDKFEVRTEQETSLQTPPEPSESPQTEALDDDGNTYDGGDMWSDQSLIAGEMSARNAVGDGNVSKTLNEPMA